MQTKYKMKYPQLFFAGLGVVNSDFLYSQTSNNHTHTDDVEAVTKVKPGTV